MKLNQSSKISCKVFVTVRNGRLALSVFQEYNIANVMAGVVGHPVSEKGERGVSPSTASSGNAKPLTGQETELACYPEQSRRKTALVNAEDHRR
jgi:hypothetical protein